MKNNTSIPFYTPTTLSLTASFVPPEPDYGIPSNEPPIPCNDQHDEVKREEIYRFKDSDPPYKESRETYYCKRPMGHEGDHSVRIKKDGMIFWWRAKNKNAITTNLGQQVIGWKEPTKPKGKGFLARLLTDDKDSTSGTESSG